MPYQKAIRKSGVTIKQQVYESLKQRIIKGLYGRGQQLRQEVLARDFGVSRIPVREALLQLEKEGLVEFFPYKGAVVTSLSADEIREVFEIRYILESAALEFAIQEMSESDYEQAENILDETDRMTDQDQWVGMNWKFHSFLYSFAKRPRLLEMVNNLHQSIDRYIRVYLRLMNFQDSSTEAHREMLKACHKGDVSQAKDLLRRHQREAMERIVAFLFEM